MRQGLCPTPPSTTTAANGTPPARPSRCRRPVRCPRARRHVRHPGAPRDARCTGTSGSSATACWSRGRCPRACRWTRAPTTSRCTPRTTRWSTPTSRATSPTGEYGGGQVAHLGPRHLRDREVDRPRGQGRPARRRGSTVATCCSGTGGKNWMMHRMDPRPARASSRCRELVRPDAGDAGATRCRRDDEQWAYEMKWDGVRAVVYVEGGRATSAVAQRHRHHAPPTPSCARWRESLGRDQVVLDGEIVAFDAAGRPSFELLQPRMHVTSAAQPGGWRRRSPVTFWSSTCCTSTAGRLLGLPYAERRAAARVAGAVRSLVADTAGVVRRRGDGAARRPGSRAWRASSPSGSSRRTSPAGVAEAGSRSSTCGPRRWWWAAGSRVGPAAGTIGSLLLGLPGR